MRYAELRDPEWMQARYVDEKMSDREIAEQVGCHTATVRIWRRRHGIPPHEPEGPPPELRDADWLRERYVDEDLTQYEIGEILDCSPVTVAAWLREHGIPVRPPGGQTDDRMRDAAWLRQRYLEDGLSAAEIADEVGYERKTVIKWLKRHEIPRRSRSW